jgi:hypothetical protein
VGKMEKLQTTNHDPIAQKLNELVEEHNRINRVLERFLEKLFNTYPKDPPNTP